MAKDAEDLATIVDAYGKLLLGLFSEELGQGRLDPNDFANLLDHALPDISGPNDHLRYLLPFLQLRDRFRT